MALTSLLPTAAKGFFTGSNWYKWGAIAVVILAIAGGSYQYGKHKCEMAHQEQKTEQAEEKTRIIVQHVKERVPVIQKDEAEAAKLKAELSNLRDLYEKAINSRPDLPQCALSSDELRYFQEAAKRTQ